MNLETMSGPALFRKLEALRERSSALGKDIIALANLSTREIYPSI